MNCKN